MIEAKCPSCGMIYHLPNQMEGKTGKCNVCKASFVLPKPLEWEDLSYNDVPTVIPRTEISSANPACIIFLVDQSLSMKENFGSSGQRKDCLADTINRFLYNMAIRCTKGDGIKDYFYVALYGYGGEGRVTDILDGVRSISWVAYNTKKMEKRKVKQGEVDVEIDFPIWIVPEAEGKTPMTAALKKAYQALSQWVNKYPRSYPPLVVNITDGDYSDENPSEIAGKIMELRTDAGKVMMMNCHISGGKGSPFFFPDNQRMKNEDGLHRMLYQISTVLPNSLVVEANKKGYKISDGARGFAFNADLVMLIDFLDLGSRAADTAEIDLIPEGQ